MPSEGELKIYLALKDAQKKADRLEHENKMLKNRCGVLTEGKMCIFCPYDCENRNGIFRGKKDGN